MHTYTNICIKIHITGYIYVYLLEPYPTLHQQFINKRMYGYMRIYTNIYIYRIGYIYMYIHLEHCQTLHQRFQ
jgi:hypothetical protein